MPTDDILFSLMYLRLYFLVEAILTCFCSTNEDLFSTRVIHDSKFSPNLFFQIQAAMINYQFIAIGTMSLLSLWFFSTTIRIYERPYYQQNDTLEFQTMGVTVWFCINCLTGIGIGVIMPSTVPGRALSIVCTVIGAFIFSILVGVILLGFELPEARNGALQKITQ